jgi:hypothetical protein
MIGSSDVALSIIIVALIVVCVVVDIEVVTGSVSLFATAC